MSTLITGATGFIGSCVARRLLALGRPVTVLARSEAKARTLAAGGAKVVIGDLEDVESLKRAAAGCGAVVHGAGVPRPASWRVFRRVHVRGTESLARAAHEAGVTRFVNISSQAVMFGGEDIVNQGDDAPYPRRYVDPYSQTKAAGERAAMAAHSAEMAVLSLRPGVVWGPGDTTILPVFAKLSRSLMGIPMCGDGSNIETTTYIDNLMDAAVLALDAPAPTRARAFVVRDGFEISWREFLAMQLEAIGVRAKFRRVPRAIALPGAWVLDTSAGVLGLPVPLARFGFLSSMTSRKFTGTGARDVIGYEPRVGLREGLAEVSAADRASRG